MTRYVFWVVVTLIYELLLNSPETYKTIIGKYIGAFLNANEYLIGMLWFLLTLFWLSLIVAFFQKLNIMEVATLIYFVIYVGYKKGQIFIFPNNAIIPLGNIFLYMRYVLIGEVIARHKNICFHKRTHIICHIGGMVGLIMYVYDGLAYHRLMQATGVSVVGFQSNWVDIICIWILIIGIYHPLTDWNSLIEKWLSTTASLLFFSQRIIIDLTRKLWKYWSHWPCTWGNLYVVVTVVICTIGAIVIFLEKNKRINSILKRIL